ncbi:MAG: hypothetical protein ABSC92_15915 [Rhizomicrobium sp.]
MDDRDLNGVGKTNTLLAVVLGALVVVVAALGFFIFNDHRGGYWHDRPIDRPSTLFHH